MRAIAPNSTGSSDGLTYTVASSTKTYTFSAGTAPPSHNFLSVVEHTQGTTSGQVDFFNLTLGGSGGADTFSAFSPATLAGTNSTNETKPDVDNPQVLAWDTNGDLLIGNGDDGGANHGNMACVPVGAISTGANTSTTVSQNVTSPTGIAYDPRDGSVALADNPATASFQLSEYLLTGNYTAATGGRNFHETGTNVGAFSVTNMVPLAGVFPGNGTYAVTRHQRLRAGRRARELRRHDTRQRDRDRRQQRHGDSRERHVDLRHRRTARDRVGRPEQPARRREQRGLAQLARVLHDHAPDRPPSRPRSSTRPLRIAAEPRRGVTGRSRRG